MRKAYTLRAEFFSYLMLITYGKRTSTNNIIL